MAREITRGPARILERLPWLLAVILTILFAGAMRLYRRRP